jgi:hypothetical protein
MRRSSVHLYCNNNRFGVSEGGKPVRKYWKRLKNLKLWFSFLPQGSLKFYSFPPLIAL